VGGLGNHTIQVGNVRDILSDGLNTSDSVAFAVESPTPQAADRLRETAISDSQIVELTG
jgi:hypothetical protein